MASLVNKMIQVWFIGENPPEHISPLAELVDGEERRGFGLWKDDMYGTGEVLGRKRRERGWSKLEEELVLEMEWEARQHLYRFQLIIERIVYSGRLGGQRL